MSVKQSSTFKKYHNTMISASFFLCLILSIVCLVFPFVPSVKKELNKLAYLSFPFVLFFLGGAFWQTAMFVDEDSRGLVTTKFGTPLSSGHVVAFDDERGPQAWMLSPGWNFALWPWQYSVQQHKNLNIPADKIALITAKDGKNLIGQAYADEWDSVQDLLDGVKFGKEGFAGPQVTVAPAGKTIAYNPNLFDIKLADALIVKQDECVVIKSNHGKKSDTVGELVPEGFIGIWNVALSPSTYYMHPLAYEPIRCKTTKRVYSYTSTSNLAKSDRPDFDHSIGVKTMDGYKFPVDVRVEVITPIEDCPFIVSKIGSLDEDPEQDGFDNLETQVILPALRSIIRNTAEHTNALDYLNSRSKVEIDATQALAKAITEEFKVKVIAVRIADVGLDDTPEGQALLKTQTDQELAKQQIKAYGEQKLAAQAEKETIEAQTAAEKQALLTESEIQIEASENKGLGESRQATGEAEAIEKKIAAYGGYTQFLMAEAINAFGNNWSGELPEVVVIGEGGNLDTAVLSKLVTNIDAETEE